MTGASITLDDTATEGLAYYVDRATHPGQLMGSIAAYMLSSTQRRFEREVGPDGQKWKPLAKRTANRQIRRGHRRGRANILRVTTRLYRSLVTQSDATSAEVGTNVAYAAVHQFGGEIQIYGRSQRATLKKIRGSNRSRFVKTGTKGGTVRNVTIGEHVITMPARPYLGFSDEDRKMILQLGEDYLLQEGAP